MRQGIGNRKCNDADLSEIDSGGGCASFLAAGGDSAFTRNDPSRNALQRLIELSGARIIDASAGQHRHHRSRKAAAEVLLGASRAVRMAVLGGFIDGDGYRVENARQYEVQQVLRPVGEFVVRLARSLGMRTSFTVPPRSQ